MPKLKANIVIIGGGGAGIVAALTAAEKGASDIMVLEKRPAPGGNSALAGGYLFAAESPPQKRANAKISRDAIFKETMAFHHYDRVNGRVIRAFIDKTGDTIRWLEENGIGYVWSPAGAYDTHALADLKKPARGFGPKLRILTNRFKAGGGQVINRTSGKKILRDSTGKVCGVVAANQDSEEIHITTRSVIITTGGFLGNKEMLKSYFPHYYDENSYSTLDLASNRGEGIQLAQEAGSSLNDYATLIRGPVGISSVGSAAADPRSVWVNKKGLRFIDEDHGYDNEASNAVIAQPGKTVFALFDDELVAAIMEPEPKAPAGSGNTPEQHIPDLRDRLQKESSSDGQAIVSDSWEKIARWMGAEPKIMQASIDEYNACCDMGRDATFAKDKKYLIPLRQPPYYAIRFGPGAVDTAGPVRVNERMEALDQKDNPIPGLYVAGVLAAGWCGYDYHHFGCALSWALNSGRIAGESAVKYALNQ